MCGLIGYVESPVSFASFDDAYTLVERIVHRGPDSNGVAWPLENVLLGHSRLAIQDAHGRSSSQPYEQGPIVLTYNGELWQHEGIDVGPRATTGDTEVVAKLLEQKSVAALADMADGMWALAWFDERDGLVRLARDPYGKIPLYWQETAAGIMWASEYGALERGPARAVQPGELITIDPETLAFKSEQYPQHVSEPLPATPENVLELLRKGVRERLIGDRPIAFMLSGGIDSTAVLALAREFYQGEIVAYTAGFEGAQDLIEARFVADHFGVELVEVPIPEVTPERVAEAVRVVEIPLKAQVECALAHLPIAQAIASDGFAVCLSGEASDELFNGYAQMMIKIGQARKTGDFEKVRAIREHAVAKMAYGNFTRSNKVGMRYGIETRLPFTERQLIELALAASFEDNPDGKRLLKAALVGIVPDRTIKRAKNTFQTGAGTGSKSVVVERDTRGYVKGSTPTSCARRTPLADNPTKLYNQIARDAFGFLPHE